MKAIAQPSLKTTTQPAMESIAEPAMEAATQSAMGTSDSVLVSQALSEATPEGKGASTEVNEARPERNGASSEAHSEGNGDRISSVLHITVRNAKLPIT